jgi:hypothetical protein
VDVPCATAAAMRTYISKGCSQPGKVISHHPEAVIPCISNGHGRTTVSGYAMPPVTRGAVTWYRTAVLQSRRPTCIECSDKGPAAVANTHDSTVVCLTKPMHHNLCSTAELQSRCPPGFTAEGPAAAASPTPIMTTCCAAKKGKRETQRNYTAK